MATEHWSPVYVLSVTSTDIASIFETSTFGETAFGVLSFGGSSDIGKEIWSTVNAAGTTESWSSITP
tara:strand:- start:128 stop:328 length:201 start_codon:yes stop_codon:yes gene_type:complete